MKALLSISFAALATVAVHANEFQQGPQQPGKDNYEMQLNNDPSLNLTIFKFFTVQPKEQAVPQNDVKLDPVIDKDWKKRILEGDLQSERSPYKAKGGPNPS